MANRTGSRSAWLALAVLVLAAATTGCGQKGDLYHPDSHLAGLLTGN